MRRDLLFVCFLLGSLVAQPQSTTLYYKNMPADIAAAKIARPLLEADMHFWLQVMEESHVNPYHAISKTALLQLQQDILKALPDSVTHAQASFAISRLIGALEEGHLGFATNKLCDSLYNYNCIRFPYLIQDVEQNAFVVQYDMSNQAALPPLSRIVEINGIPVQQLYQKYEKFYGGLTGWKKQAVRNNIRKLLYLDGITSPFTIKAFNTRDTVLIKVDGYNRLQADSLTKVLSTLVATPVPFSLRFTENNIALIEFNSMNSRNREAFGKFLYRAFDTIRQAKAAGVIIDLRKNGGGDSGLGDSLISYITDKPYRNAGGMKFRISSHYKAFCKLLNNNEFESWENKLYTYPAEKPQKPVTRSLRYKGKVCVLIGPATFSSANMLTNAIKDFHLATLIGESTAEPANDFGEIFTFMLPNTYIVCRGACKMFTRANGDEKDFSGIHPDIEVATTQEAIRRRQDIVLETAIRWVLKP